MTDDRGRPRVALIAGPTASGKSAIALALAKAVPATIINADASQVYRDLRILSARPSEDEEDTCPHRLFGHVDGAESCSAAHWASDAITEISRAHQAGRLPVLVGGTGLYLRTLLDGIAPVPEIDPDIRNAVRQLDVRDAFAALAREDAGAAARLAPADSSRVARALEVIRSTGRPMADWQKERVGGIAGDVSLVPLILLPPRAWLFERCDARLSMMFDTGGVAEVEALLARQLSPSLPVMRAIGVREIAGFLQRTLTRDEALAAARIATRQYAKRQYTWFRNQSPPAWPRAEQTLNDEDVSHLVIKLQQLPLT